METIILKLAGKDTGVVLLKEILINNLATIKLIMFIQDSTEVLIIILNRIIRKPQKNPSTYIIVPYQPIFL